MRNAVFVSIFVLLNMFLISCGGGGSGGSDGSFGDNIPNNCDNPTPFRGYNPSAAADQQNGEVTASYELPSDCYLISNLIKVTQNAQLTISPRTTLLFASGASLIVEGGSIIANGNANAPIYFTGQIKQPGGWRGIRINYPNSSNQTYSSFMYTVIEYAGQDGLSITRPSHSIGVVNRTLGDNAGRINFTNNIIRHGGGEFAFYAATKSLFERFENNLIYDNQGNPIYIDGNEVHRIASSNRFNKSGQDNQENTIYVSGNRIDSQYLLQLGLSTDISWKKLEIPYLITEDLEIYNTNLSLDPGVELQFEVSAGLEINEPNASLFAKGQQKNPIKFTLKDSYLSSNGFTNTYWKGVRFIRSNNIRNRIEYTTIEYGGDPSVLNNQANISIIDNSYVSLNNSTLKNSSGYGLIVDGDSVIPEFNNNWLLENLAGIAKVSSKSVRYLSNSSRYVGAGNSGNFIIIDDDGLNSTDTWQGLEVPYAFITDFYVDQNLTIEAGAILLFENDKKMVVESAGSLVVNGTSRDPVEFSSLTQYINQNGFNNSYWQGIVFNSSAGRPINELNFVRIEYAGATQIFNAPSAALTLRSLSQQTNTQLELSNTTIESVFPNSWGVYKDENSQLIQGANNNLFSICDQQINGFC